MPSLPDPVPLSGADPYDALTLAGIARAQTPAMSAIKRRRAAGRDWLVLVVKVFIRSSSEWWDYLTRRSSVSCLTGALQAANSR
jgi:hypothetical protein